MPKAEQELSLRAEAVQAHERTVSDRERVRARRRDELRRKAEAAFSRAFRCEGEAIIVEDEGDEEAEFHVDGLELRYVREKTDRHGRAQPGFFVMRTCETCEARTPARFIEDLPDLGAYLEDDPDFACPHCVAQGNGHAEPSPLRRWLRRREK